MDSKITKGRLGTLFSYDWIYLIVIVVMCSFIMSFIYGIIAIKPTPGQAFNYFYDYEISASADESLALLYKNTFSFDVRDVIVDELTEQEGESILTAKIENGEGDIIFTHIHGSFKENEGYYSCRAHDVIDFKPVYALDNKEGGLLYDLEKYLSQFLVKEGDYPFDYNNLSEQKIKDNFNERTAGKRVYKNDLRKGIVTVDMELERIKNLCVEADFFARVIAYDSTLDQSQSIFYRYKRYTQASFEADRFDRESFAQKTATETERPYALDLYKLTGGKTVSDYFKMKDTNLKGGVVAVVINLNERQPDLQFETVSFINTIIRNFSDLAEKI